MPDATLLREQGAALLRDGRAIDALVPLREATAMAPGDVLAWRLLGGALAQCARADEALGAFEEASRLQPEAAKNHYNVALTLLTLERKSDARERLERALALDPGYEQARLRLAELGAVPVITTPPPLTPPVPPSPLATLGGGTESVPPPPGSYAPPAQRGYAPSGPSPVNGTLPLILGIVGLVLCQFASPVAWVMGDNAVRTLNAAPHLDQSQRGSAMAGKILGIIGTVLLGLTVLVTVVAVVIAALSPDSRN